MNTRPRIKVELKGTDRLIEALCIGLLVGFWVFAWHAYSTMPDIIPTHFDASGKPDAEGSRSTIWIMPAIASVSYVLLTLLNRVPHIFNYPVRITEGNAAFQYRNATRMIRVMNLVLIVTFFIIGVIMYRVAMGKMEGTGTAIILVVMILPIVPVLYYLIKARKGA